MILINLKKIISYIFLINKQQNFDIKIIIKFKDIFLKQIITKISFFKVKR